MGTETLNILVFLLINFDTVKLNTPPMGTETGLL